MLANARHAAIPQRLLFCVQKSTNHCYSTAKQSLSGKKVTDDDWDKLSTSLIKGARYGAQRPGWKEEYKMNKSSVLDESSIVHPARWLASPSPERIEFAGHPSAPRTALEGASGLLGNSDLAVGDFVEIRRVDAVRHGVVLDVVQGRIPAATILVSSGEAFSVLSTDAMFVIPRFIERDLIWRCGKTEFAIDQRMLSARQRVVKAIREFERAVEDVHCAIAWDVRTLYDKVKSDDPHSWAEITTMEASRLIRNPPNPPIIRLFALHKHLMGRSDEFVAQTIMHRQSHKFNVRPERQVQNLRTVLGWVRSKHSTFSTFCAKAKTLIEISRQHANSSVGEPPTMVSQLGEQFSPSDMEFIDVLRLSLENTRFNQTNPYAIAVPAIVKAIGKYSGDVDTSVVLDLLRDIGVHSPWEDVASNDRDFRLFVGEHRNSSLPTNREEGLLANDPHESVRHDFGQLPVFVIDDASAEELDDGISYERDPSDENALWLHVHIADPTSLLLPTHPIALQARKQLESTYFTHGSNPLLPKNLIKCGLHASSGSTPPQKVLTFSTKLNRSGDILDYKVRAGLVRVVSTLTYDEVDAVLGLTNKVNRHAFAPLQTLPSAPLDLSRALPHKETLLSIWQATESIVAARMKLPVFSYTRLFPEMTMTPRPPPAVPDNSKHAVFFRGFPTLSYNVVDSDDSTTGSRSVVAECMKLSCRISSRFCVDHRLPMFRRTAKPFEFADASDLDKVLALRNPRGLVSDRDMGHFRFNAPSGEYTLEPKAHWGMGIADGEGYIRATSPLRRYQDMVAHWQIKSALLPASQQTNAPFSENELISLMSEVSRHGQVLGRVRRHQERYWAHKYIDRYLRSCTDDNHLLRNLDAYAMNIGMKDVRRMVYHTDVTIPSLGLVGDLRTAKALPLSYGTELKVKVSHVERGLFPTMILELDKSL